MDALIFTIRAFIITVALVLIMQVNVGDERLEYKVADFIRGSVITNSLQGVADGAVKVIRDSWGKVSKGMNSVISRATSSDGPGERSEAIFNWKRSKEVAEEKSRSIKDTIQSRLKEEGIIETKDSQDFKKE